MKGLSRILLVATMLFVAVGMFAEDLINVPSYQTALNFYEDWRDGTTVKDWYPNEDGDYVFTEYDAPGYIYEFELPETVYLDRRAMYKPGEEHLASDDYPCVTNPSLGYGSTSGAIVLMGANGDDSEFPSEAGVCVSTDEAMGYGMMLAVMADDQETFNKLARVVEYYKTNYPEYDQLTSWVIPAVASGNYSDYQDIEDFVDARIAEGWEYQQQDGWINTPKDLWGTKKEFAVNGSGAIIGDELVITPYNNQGSSVSGIAMDGSLDIAFAFLMAHLKWYNGDVPSMQQGDLYYLGMACDRYSQIIQAINTFGVNPDGHKFLPKGTYNLLGEGANGITRPSDWLVTHLRAYYECVGDEDTRKMIGILQDQMNDFADEDSLASGISVPNAPSNTGFVPDFAEYNGTQLDAVHTNGVIFENRPETFHINAARYPFRQALDYLLYGDEYALNRAIDAIKLPYAKFKGNWANTASVTNSSPYGTPFDAGWELNGTTFGGYANKVLQSSVMTTIYAANKAGITDYNDMFNEYMATGLEDWISYYNFRSQYTFYNERRAFTRTKDGVTEVDDHFVYYKDPKGNSGYFEDTWVLLSLFTLSEAWERPHAYLNEFDDPGTSWIVSADSTQYADINESNGVVTVTIKGNPGTNDVNIEVKDFVTKINSGYAFMMSIERQNGGGPSSIDGYLYYPDYSTEDNVEMKGRIIIDENDVTRGYMGHFNGIVTSVPDGMQEQQKGRIVINLNAPDESGNQSTVLDNDTVFVFTELGLYDPPEHVERYRYVGQWRSDEPYYLEGDYVSHNLDTWVCIKAHDTTRSSVPQEGSEFWELSDYNLVGERWKSGTFYEDGDLVHFQGRTYIARVPFHSVTEPPKAPSVWMLYYDPYKGQATDWFQGAEYLVGDLVHFNGNIYECRVAHAAIPGWDPVTAFTLWTKVNSKFSSINPFPWETWTTYEAGSVVMYDGYIYTCLTPHTSQPGWTPDAIGALWKKN